MAPLNRRLAWETAKWSIAGLLATALLTAVAFRLHLTFTAASPCYLLLVVLVSLSGNLASSGLVSVAAVASLNYFFVEPIFSFRINDPVNVLALISFLVTGLVIAILVTKVRAKAAASELNHRKMEELYTLAQKLLALEQDIKPSNEFLELFVGHFGIRGACLKDAASSELAIAGESRALLAQKTVEAFTSERDLEGPAAGISVQCIRVAGKVIGAIGFDGLQDPELTARPLGALGAAHLERTHSFRNASQAAAAAQAESYRSAILDALAHEFKTPLATIMAAAGALREVSALGPDEREMAETVESQAARLSRLTTRLIRTARLEQEEVRPWMELIDLSSVLAKTVDQYAKLSPDRKISVDQECKSCEVVGDPELLQLAVSQLLDNACKYSTPGSPVILRVSREPEYVALRVQSHGNSVPASEKQKIFDRFYRGVSGHRMAPGSGLGLFVARKIALAHGGTLELDTEEGAVGDTRFLLLLPSPENESRRDRTDIRATV